MDENFTQDGLFNWRELMTTNVETVKVSGSNRYIWICIPVFNRIALTLKCLSTLNAQTHKNFTVVICDHGSTDGTSERIKLDFPDVVVINADSTLWWTGAINFCVSYVLQHAAASDYLLTLNNDTELPANYLSELAAYSSKYPHAVLSSVVYDIATGKIFKIGERQNWLTARAVAVTFEYDHLADEENIIEVTHASGRGAMFPVAAFRQLGLYDQQHLPHYGADDDFSHKVRRAGFPIYVCKSCRVFGHVEVNRMTIARNQFSLTRFIEYLTSIRSAANLKVRWWYGWNNCPKVLFPSYIVLDVLRIVGSYFKHFLLAKP
ncbi:MAG: glycosyltransferase family 2 protein [Methylobacter sp.]|nr:glycosyltransferase family 2 protein [Methylococcales bacterium]MDD5115345.1 glycosyltransferase family 2 protein [Methylobacter sp.]